MERMTRRARLICMMNPRPLRGLAGRRGLLGVVGPGLVFAALVGCGSVVASSGAAAAPAAPAAAPAAASAPQVGCASVNQATAVEIGRMTGLVKSAGNDPIRATTYRQVAKVRALFGQICAAVTHPSKTLITHCPADFGTTYLGTFYDGSRALAEFTYAMTGCERVSLTAAGKTQATTVYGSAAAAAPHLAKDLEALVGTPEPGLGQGAVNPGGPNMPA
jgi:hypothetical protein